MRKKQSKYDSSTIWDAVFSLQEGGDVDMSSFSEEEKNEIQESLSIIRAIEASQDDTPSPSMEGFASVMGILSQEKYCSRKQGDWGNFLRMWFSTKRRWAVVPVLALLITSVSLWPQKNDMKVAAAETLSAEIQKDFQDMYQEIEEVELLKKELDLAYNQSNRPIPYF
jgi:hypothetical protein